jgi:hypothetical protein
MRISEVLPFDRYWRDPRFVRKKPKPQGPWRNRCGDNVYQLNGRGRWVADPLSFHPLPQQIAQDLKNPNTFVSDHFYYFGEAAPKMPEAYRLLLRDRQGCRCNQDPNVVDGFIQWLKRTYDPGVHGEPRDRDRSGCRRDAAERAACTKPEPGGRQALAKRGARTPEC